MAVYYFQFDQIVDSNLTVVGGKAANLGRMVQVGLAVPLGFVITTDFFWQFLTENGIKTRLNELADLTTDAALAQLDSLRAAINQANLSSQQLAQLAMALADTPDGARFAVRSSATSEDLAEASFAGQYDTFLNVSGLPEIAEKVKACFASYWNDRAYDYRTQKGIDHFQHGMAVVVQQLIDAESAGVLFTLNPLTGNEREMVIEACWGLGEALVSGQVSPDRFLLDPFSQQLLERQISEKSLMMISDGSNGVVELPLGADEARRPALNEQQVWQLTELALKVQQHYGRPLDIEWAYSGGKFYILQARPLTAYSFSPQLGQWTSANFREVMPGLVNPLSFSLSLRYDYGHSLAEFFRRVGLKRDDRPVEWSRRFFGRAYWNLSIVKHFAAKIPGYNERTFDTTVGIEPDYDGDGQRTPFTLSTLVRALPVYLRLRWLYWRFWREASRFQTEFAGWERELTELDLASLSDSKLVEQTRRMIELHYRTNRIAMICSFLATESQNDFRDYVEKINQRLSAENQISVANLLTGLSDLSTAEPLIELWQLANEARSQPVLTALINDAEPHYLIYACEHLEEGQEFVQRLKDYLYRFRFLAANDEDLSCPRWADDPTFPLTVLQNFVRGESSENPADAINRQQQRREFEQQRALKQIGRLRRFGFMAKLRLVTRYCRWREITRIPLSKIYYFCREVFNEQSRRLVRDGILEKVEDIYWLEREELLDLLAGTLSAEGAKQRISTARLINDCYRNFSPPATIGKGAVINAPKAMAVGNGLVYRGVACSAGTVMARARIIRSLSEAGKLQRGDVMIAPHTNPGWTPLFSLAAAVVLEEGGLLSHGAVVARECGIPTVLQIKGATEIFRDGQLLRVDGSSGEVEIVVEE